MSQLNQKGPHRYESQPGSPIPFDVIIPGHTIIDETKGENTLIRGLPEKLEPILIKKDFVAPGEWVVSLVK